MNTLIKILSFLPLRALYGLGDVLTYPIMFYIVRYRRKIVRKNLSKAFPEKSLREIMVLEKMFYHHFVDVVAEIIWSYRASEAEMLERFESVNVDMVEELAQRKGGVIFMLGHLGNWEWTADVQQRFVNPEMRHYNVYRRLKNQSADKAMIAIREKRSGNGSCIEKNSLLRELIRLKKEQAKFTLGLIADQKPTPKNAHYWTTFLHQDTAFLDGGEMIAKKFDYPVTYVHMSSPRRGYYTARVELITDEPATTPENFITEAFARKLEANILEAPHLWLWSHNRWKFSRPSVVEEQK